MSEVREWREGDHVFIIGGFYDGKDGWLKQPLQDGRYLVNLGWGNFASIEQKYFIYDIG